MIALFAATLLTAQFKGGTPNEFVQFLAESTRQNVVLASGEAKPIRPATLQIADKERWSKEIQAQTSLSLLSNEGLVLSDLTLPRNRVSVTLNPDIYSKGKTSKESAKEYSDIVLGSEPVKAIAVHFIGIPTTAIRAGRITFNTERTNALSVARLSQILSKPIKSHWFYREAPLFVQVRNLPERDFMKMIAKSLGAKLVERPESYDLELDPFEIRQRAIATIMKHVHKDDTAAEWRNFRIACLKHLTSVHIAKALKSPNEQLTIEAPAKSVLASLILNLLKERASNEATWPAASAKGKVATYTLQYVKNGMFITLDAQFAVQIGVRAPSHVIYMP